MRIVCELTFNTGAVGAGVTGLGAGGVGGAGVASTDRIPILKEKFAGCDPPSKTAQLPAASVPVHKPGDDSVSRTFAVSQSVRGLVNGKQSTIVPGKLFV